MKSLLVVPALFATILLAAIVTSDSSTLDWRPDSGLVWGGQDSVECDDPYFFFSCYMEADSELVCTLYPGEEEAQCEDIPCEYDSNQGYRCPHTSTRKLNTIEERTRVTQQQAAGISRCYYVDSEGNRTLYYCDYIGPNDTTSKQTTRIQEDCFIEYTCHTGWGNCAVKTSGARICATASQQTTGTEFHEKLHPGFPCPTDDEIREKLLECEGQD
ncbi:MAG: hypothetical protein KatS3mg111_4089 [Pirellulaceae bacterium]|nr:MAG: hypothetical protein KatS3mg111_4089 [Pirellulaceae bacterium]